MNVKEVTGQSFWEWVDKLDQAHNPEAFSYRQQAEKSTDDSTNIVTKIADKAPKYTNRARKDLPTSPGWKGRARAQYRAGLITLEQLKRQLQID